MAAASRVARAAFSRHLRAFCVGCRTYEGNLGRAARTALVGRRGVSSNIEGPEHVVVIGGGALGSLFAGRLGALNALRGRVWMLTSWEEQAAAVESNQGVVVQEQGSVGSGCLIGEVRAMRHLAEVRELQTNTVNTKVRGRVNVVIIAVKQTGIRKAAEQAAQILAGVHGGLCITVLNGLGHIEVVNNALRNHDLGYLIEDRGIMVALAAEAICKGSSAIGISQEYGFGLATSEQIARAMYIDVCPEMAP